MKKIAAAVILSVAAMLLSSCAGTEGFDATVTTAIGPADTALPRQMIFAVGEDADAVIMEAAKNFCDRVNTFSGGGVMFSLVSTDHALRDLHSGNADMALIENSDIDAFSPMSEPFRYKSYEHFSMSANAAQTLKQLSEYAGANVLVGFYTGSNVFLSDGKLDAVFRTDRNSDATGDRQPEQAVSAAMIGADTARVFSLTGIRATAESGLEARIEGFVANRGIMELKYSELDSLLLAQAVVQKAAVAADPDGDDRIYLTPAFTGINPIWLIATTESYDRLPQKNRAAVSEAVAYMAGEIDGYFLEYERARIEEFVLDEVTVTRDVSAARVLALRLSDSRAPRYTSEQKKLRDILAGIV